jgi:hypothetical protein
MGGNKKFIKNVDGENCWKLTTGNTEKEMGVFFKNVSLL